MSRAKTLDLTAARRQRAYRLAVYRARRGSAGLVMAPLADVRAAALAMVREGYRVALYSGERGEQFLLVRDEAARQRLPAGETRAVYTLAEIEAGALPEMGALA